MKLNINFLQTGGVPLTADLMDNIEEQIKFYDFLGDLAGNLTILSGCVITGSNVGPGVVAINGECYYFEGGLATSTVYINTQQIYKTFQDQTDKILIERKTVKFGTSTPANTFNWVEFTKLDTLKEMQIKIGNAATQVSLNALIKRVEKVELKTAPIINGGVVWIWKLPASQIPAGWKECTDLRGKTVFGRDPNDDQYSTLGVSGGSSTKTILKTNLPNLDTNITVLQPYEGSLASGGFDGGGNTWRNKTFTLNPGGNSIPINILNPHRIVNFIEPDLP